MEEEGLFSFLHSHLVDDEIAVLSISLSGKEAQLSGLEDEQIEVTLVAQNELLGMRYLGLYDFSE